MTDKYDCTADVKKHVGKVQYWMNDFAAVITGRATIHDKSKLEEPEKSMFDEFTPKLKELTFGSKEYRQALKDMGGALQHHYEANSHHPEHYPNGVDGITLLDVIEMVCDWMAACEAKGVPMDLKHAAERFKLSPQLVNIIRNTLKQQDYWNHIYGVPVIDFIQD